MKHPRISVVIPLYNKANHILDTLHSVRQQKYPVREIIVVDDGSSDNGAQIVEQANLPDVRLIKQSNQGVSAARNTGIQAAKYEYVTFLDADDQWLPFFTEEMYYLIERFPHVGIYTSRYQAVEEDEQYVDINIALEGADPDGMLLDNFFDIASKGDLPFMISSTLVHKSLLQEIGGFPVGEKIGEDQDFFVRAALRGPIAYSPNINLIYHKEADNRACERNIPETECPFSARLEQLPHKISKGLQMDIERYRAAHICHLAKLNLYKGKIPQALRLLSDPKCYSKPVHKVVLTTLAWSRLAMLTLTEASQAFMKLAFPNSQVKAGGSK